MCFREGLGWEGVGCMACAALLHGPQMAHFRKVCGGVLRSPAQAPACSGCRLNCQNRSGAGCRSCSLATTIIRPGRCEGSMAYKQILGWKEWRRREARQAYHVTPVGISLGLQVPSPQGVFHD